MKPLVSIGIPTARFYKSNDLLERLLSSISCQSFKDMEVIVSDHAKDPKTEEIVDAYRVVVPNLIYRSFNEKRGFAAANLNNTIRLSTGKYYKPIFQDDYLIGRDAILDMVNAIRDSKWLAVGCLHCDDDGKDLKYYHPPKFDSSLNGCHGHNLIGSPSVVMFERENCELFDENLRFYNDCELYYRIGKKYGSPVFISNPLIYIRLSSHGVSSLTTENEKLIEHRYLDQKHGQGL